MPLVSAPSQNIDCFACAIKALDLDIDDWTLHHERVQKFDEEIGNSKSKADILHHENQSSRAGGSLHGSRLRSAVTNALGGRPNHRTPSTLYVILESDLGFTFGVATWSHARSMLDGMVDLWNQRPTHFSSALDPLVASIAVSCACQHPGQTVLDPCCGSGTLLFAALGMGARTVVGLDMSLHMVHLARRNLEAVGYPTRGGGALRRWAGEQGDGPEEDESAERGQVCMVGQHDMRDGWRAWGLGRLRRVDAVVANLPHGKNLRLPYDGYVADMLRSLRDCFLGEGSEDGGEGDSGGERRAGPRFVIIGGARLLEEGSGNTLRAALEDCGFEGLRAVPALGGALALVSARLGRARAG